MIKKRTDGGHEIPEEDLREMEQEEGREMPDGVEPGRCGRSRDVQVRV